MDLSTWQDQITMWYEQRKHDQVEKLETILYQVPDDVFGPELSALKVKRLLAGWMDVYACFNMQGTKTLRKHIKPCFIRVQSLNKQHAKSRLIF